MPELVCLFLNKCIFHRYASLFLLCQQNKIACQRKIVFGILFQIVFEELTCFSVFFTALCILFGLLKLDYKVTWQKIKDVFRRAGE